LFKFKDPFTHAAVRCSDRCAARCCFSYSKTVVATFKSGFGVRQGH